MRTAWDQVAGWAEDTAGGIQVAVSDLATPVSIEIAHDAGLVFPAFAATGNDFHAPVQQDRALWLHESKINRCFFLPETATPLLERVPPGTRLIERVQAGEARVYLVDEVRTVAPYEIDVLSQRIARLTLLAPRGDKVLVVTATLAVERK